MIVKHRLVVPWIAAVVVAFQVTALVDGNTRTWKSASGKQKIEAEFVKANENSVTIKRADGREVIVPLEKLCEADREFVAAALLDEKLADEKTKLVRGKVIRFYQIVRKSDKSDLKDLLPEAAQAQFDANSSFFDTITRPDRGSAPRVKHVRFEQDQAVAEVSIKFRGKYYPLSVDLVRQGDDWRIRSLSAEDEEGQLKKMDFVTAQTVNVSDGQPDATAPMEGTALRGGDPRAEFDERQEFRGANGPGPREPIGGPTTGAPATGAPETGAPPHDSPPPGHQPPPREHEPPPRGHQPPPRESPPPEPEHDPGDEVD